MIRIIIGGTAIDIDDSVRYFEVKHIPTKVEDPETEDPLGDPAQVTDCDLNKENPFWKPRIGEMVHIVPDGDGHCTVYTTTDPVPIHDVDISRFTRM